LSIRGEENERILKKETKRNEEKRREQQQLWQNSDGSFLQSSWVADAVIPHFAPMIYIAVRHPHRHDGLASVLRANLSLGNFGAEDEGFAFKSIVGRLYCYLR